MHCMGSCLSWITGTPDKTDTSVRSVGIQTDTSSVESWCDLEACHICGEQYIGFGEAAARQTQGHPLSSAERFESRMQPMTFLDRCRRCKKACCAILPLQEFHECSDYELMHRICGRCREVWKYECQTCFLTMTRPTECGVCDEPLCDACAIIVTYDGQSYVPLCKKCVTPTNSSNWGEPPSAEAFDDDDDDDSHDI